MGSFYFLPGWVGDVLQSFAQSSQNLLKRSELNSVGKAKPTDVM